MQFTAIILAGGQSTRMSTDKALLKWRNSTLIENAINVCSSVCEKILISSNHPEHSSFGLPLISDEISGCGPIVGINSCLKKSETLWNLILSVDTPFVSVEFLRYLILQKEEFDSVIPVHSGGIEPLVALYSKTTIPIFETQIQKRDYKMQNLVRLINTNFVGSNEWIIKNKMLFKNLNRPEDL